MMKSSKIFLASLIGLLSLGCLEASLVWEETKLFFDAKEGDEKIEAIYKFTNEGDEPVTIFGARASCGCTVPELTKNLYGPGEQGQINAVFTIGDRIGHQRKVITVTTDDQDVPKVDLVLEAHIKELTNVTPRFILWKRNAQTELKTINISSQIDSDIKIESVSAEHFTTELKTVKEGRSYKIELKPTDATWVGRSLVLVKVNGANGMRTYRVHLRAQ